jgi:DNA-binding NtrC family response regulator
MNSFRNHIAENRPLEPVPPRRQDKIFENIEKLPTIREANSALIEEALQRAHGNQRLSSSMLGITPSALNKRPRAED